MDDGDVVDEENCVSSLLALRTSQSSKNALQCDTYLGVLHRVIPSKSTYLDNQDIISNLDATLLLSPVHPQVSTNSVTSAPYPIGTTHHNRGPYNPNAHGMSATVSLSKPDRGTPIKAKPKVDLSLLSTRSRHPLAALNPNIPQRLESQSKFKDLERILAQKIDGRGDSSHIDLIEFYNVIQETKGKSLQDVYLQLYDVLHVNVRIDSDNVKMIRNNINFKIKNMLESYPHLRFYGEAKDFNLTRLRAVPEVLVTLEDVGLRDKFLTTRVGRVKVV